MARKKPDPAQGDLFYEPVYPSRRAADALELSGFRGRLKRAMSRALKECPYDRFEVAARMAQALGQDSFSKAMLDAYTAESKEGHDISLHRFKAFVRATEQTWLWDFVVADDGLTILVGDEARLAEASLLRQRMKELGEQLKSLESRPVVLNRRRRAE
jgi:hypothetical protein